MPVSPSFGFDAALAVALVLLLAPALMLLAAGLARRQEALAWSLASSVSLATAGAALVCGLTAWMIGPRVVAPAVWLPAVRLDTLSALMLGLAGVLGWVIVRYSRRYLAGDPGTRVYLRDLAVTLATIWLLVTTNHLLVMLCAWFANDALLHRLLTDRERPAALLAARKRLLAAAGANACFLIGALILYRAHGTLALDSLAMALAQAPEAVGARAAALLFAAGVVLKCAQLPVHGWLLQVMEAPTPVSALLHAGIVNIGGFILLRLTGLLEHSFAAQTLLVLAGTFTACLAALVMMTRISVKVMLAWSTCAQMGFMLVEIGLGAYSLALLHLLAHSLYKAHAFLASGETVRARIRLSGAGAMAVARGGRWPVLAGAAVCVLLAGYATGLDPAAAPVQCFLGLVLITGLAPLLPPAGAGRAAPALWAGAIGLVLAYGLWHRLFADLLPSAQAPSWGLLALPVTGLLLLLAIQETVLACPDGRLSRWLHPRAFAGFYLDEALTRLTHRLWPASASMRAPARVGSAPPLSILTRESP